MLCTGSLSQKRSRLLERLKMEEELVLHRKKLEHRNVDENAFYCIEDELLCTLHIENRIGLATMNLLFLESHGNCDNGL